MNKLFGLVYFGLLSFLSITSCSTQDNSKSLADNIRLFEETPAWNLAKAVKDEDTVRIKEIVLHDKIPVDFQEPKFGITLLTWTAITHHYNSAKTLLELGANPNKSDNYKGANSIMDEIFWNCHNEDTKFLQLLLQHGGNANSVEQGKRQEGNTTRYTPLLLAAFCSLEKTKLLVEAGADINYVNEYNQTALGEANKSVGDATKITHYLLIEKKADFKKTFVVTIQGDTTSFAGLLRYWTFDLNSEDYKIKMEIVNYLKERGQDYWKTEIPKHYFDNYPKEYLEKY